MKIPVRHMTDGLHEFSETVNAIQLNSENASPFTGDIAVTVHANKHLATMHCKVDIRTTAVLECDRCLSSVERLLDLQPQLLIRFGPDKLETEEDDVLHVQPDQLDFDLSPWIREHLLVELPMKILCKEDCAGFCAGCGQNLNDRNCHCDNTATDPRWEKLKQLKSE